jgi:enoyl-CoA hydratase
VSYISTRVVEGAMVLTADRPPANAMNVEFLGELVERLEEIAADPPNALVIAGREGFFSAGADLKAVPGYDVEDQRGMVAAINRMVISTHGLPCPVIAAVTGHAIAGGLVFALCSDYRVASDAGRYGLTEVKVAVPYPAAAIAVVRAELSPNAARKLVLGNRLTDAEECLRLGVFDEVLPAEGVAVRALELAAELAALPAAVYAQTKLELRGATLSQMRVAAEEDPLLATWVSAGDRTW